MSHSHAERKVTEEDKNFPNLELKAPTGNQALDDFVTSGIKLIEELPRIWRKAIIYRIKYNRDELASELKQSPLKTAMIVQNIIFYLAMGRNIRNYTWWSEAETLINEQLLRFCYDVPILTLWKEKNPVLAHIAAQYKKYLLEQQKNYEKRIKLLDTMIESVTTQDHKAVSPRELEKTFTACAIKEELFFKLEDQCSELLKTTRTEWNPYFLYPLLRPNVLLLIANMLVYMSDQVKRHKPKFTFFSKKSFIEKLQALDDMLQIEMKQIAEVLFWQEKSLHESGSADLIGKLSKDLNTILYPHLNTKQFNCRKYVCRIDEWDHVDLDLINLFSKIQHLESGVEVFYRFAPKEPSMQSQNLARQEFIKKYGSMEAKKELQLFSDFNFISTKLLSLQNDEFKQRNQIRDKINLYVKGERLRIGVMPRLHMFASVEPFSEATMLEELKKYGRSSEGVATAKKLCLLQRIYLNINDKAAWEEIIKLCVIRKEKKLTLMLISLLQEFCSCAKIEIQINDKDTSVLQKNLPVIERLIDNLQNSLPVVPEYKSLVVRR